MIYNWPGDLSPSPRPAAENTRVTYIYIYIHITVYTYKVVLVYECVHNATDIIYCYTYNIYACVIIQSHRCTRIFFFPRQMSARQRWKKPRSHAYLHRGRNLQYARARGQHKYIYIYFSALLRGARLRRCNADDE